MTRELLLVGIGGFAGSIIRYLTYVWFISKNLTTFPWATLLINVLGCLLIGIFSALIEKEIPHHRYLFLIGSMGFLGAYTTFSTFGLETFHLMKHQGFALAAVNVVASVVLGLVAVWLGRFILN